MAILSLRGPPTGKDSTIPGQGEASLYAAGCEVAHVRQIAARGAKVGWESFLLDIKTAFLNTLLLDSVNPRTAPPPTLTDNPSEIVAVRPPKILVVQLKKGEYYLCLRAVSTALTSPQVAWGAWKHSNAFRYACPRSPNGCWICA